MAEMADGHLTLGALSSRLRHMYKIVGADQKEYGPVDADQIRKWIAEGRANGQTLARLEEGPWKPLSAFPEFALDLSNAPVPPVMTAAILPTSGAPYVPNYLVQAILVTICCCWPLGIPAIVYAAQVNSKLAAGDIAGAQYSSDRAKMWCWISFVAAFISTAIFIIMTATGVYTVPNFPQGR